MFEYRVWTFLPHKLSDEQLQQELNRLGVEGWDMVSVMASIRQSGEMRAVFKRLQKSTDI